MIRSNTGPGRWVSGVAGGGNVASSVSDVGRLGRFGNSAGQGGQSSAVFFAVCGIVSGGVFNPILGSSRSLVATSGLKNVRKLPGGTKVSLGSFSEATSVFEPHRLEGLVKHFVVR